MDGCLKLVSIQVVHTYCDTASPLKVSIIIRARGPEQTHVVVEGLGLTGVFTCVSSLWSCTVQVPENAKTFRKKQAERRMMPNDRR